MVFLSASPDQLRSGHAHVARQLQAGIPGALALAVLCEMLGRDERLQVFFDRVAVCTRHLDHLAYCQPSVQNRSTQKIIQKYP